jgi:hypothetical protein
VSRRTAHTVLVFFLAPPLACALVGCGSSASSPDGGYSQDSSAPPHEDAAIGDGRSQHTSDATASGTDAGSLDARADADTGLVSRDVGAEAEPSSYGCQADQSVVACHVLDAAVTFCESPFVLANCCDGPLGETCVNQRTDFNDAGEIVAWPVVGVCCPASGYAP